MSQIGCIYKITFKYNKNKSYIGFAYDFEERMCEHYCAHTKINEPKFERNLLYRAMRKYGPDKFVVTIIEQCKKINLPQREIYWIKFYETWYPKTNKGYNLTPGGNGGATMLGKKQSIETINKRIQTRRSKNNYIRTKEMINQTEKTKKERGSNLGNKNGSY